MTDLTGQTLGNYRIESLIGSGGMGQVFRGVHIHLGQPAAIKVLHASLATESDFRARFLQEAQSAARLKHPNIIQVHDFGEQDGKLYLVMELITGGSLRSLLAERAGGRQGASLQSMTDLVKQTADGLAAAHAQAMVHRDIKPENLLLDPRGDGTYIVKISDFGLVRLADRGILSSMGAPVGTPPYMSPEQCQGVELDGRSDLYSLGVVLYEVATGLLPFDSKTLSSAIHSHIYVAPPPPRQIRPELSADLDAIILRCLAKNRDERFASATELSAALDAWIRSTSSVVNTTFGERSQPDARGNRVQVLDQYGRTVQTVELTRRGLTIGRDAGNDVRLDSEEVSRFHARIDWDGQNVVLTDLGSNKGTLLEGYRLVPQAGQVWDRQQPVSLGPFTLRFNLAAPPPVRPTPSPVILKHTELALEKKEMSITPGQPAVCKATIVNAGPIVEHVSIGVEGVPEGWVQGPGRKVQLNPGTRSDVLLTINVPKAPASRAGVYAVTVASKSDEDPGGGSSQQALWTVQPFSAMSLAIAPAKASASKQATYDVTLHNQGNAPANYALSSKDDENKLARFFDMGDRSLKPAVSMDVEPGGSPSVKLSVSVPRRWVGTPVSHNFSVQAASPASGDAKTTSAQFIHRALLPPWAIPVILVVLGAFGWLLHVLLKPDTPEITVEQAGTPPDKPVWVNQTVVLRLAAKRASSFTLDPAGKPSSTKEGEYTFEKGFNQQTVVTATALNLFGSTQNIRTIEVATPTIKPPNIQVWSVSPPQVSEGQWVTVTWTVLNADSVNLEPYGTVDPQGSKTFKPNHTQTYKLTATKEGAPSAERETEVNVVPAAAKEKGPLPKTPDFAGTWVEINPSNPARPAIMTLTQTGEQVFWGKNVFTVNGPTATRTTPLTCKTTGGTGATGVARETLSLQGPNLILGGSTTWNSKCGVTPAGTVNLPSKTLQKQTGSPNNHRPASPSQGSQGSGPQGPPGRDIAGAAAEGLVWIDAATRLYYTKDDKAYGLTKLGKFVPEAVALDGGYHSAHAPSTGGTQQGSGSEGPSDAVIARAKAAHLVWVFLPKKVYLTQDDQNYGKTKQGKFMTLKEALSEGYRPASPPAK